MIHLVLLSGGSGSRLWPLSNNARSKQFLKVLRNDAGKPISMVQHTFASLKKIKAEFDVTIATCMAQKASLESQIEGDYELVLEPSRRDTAPAIMLAAAHLISVQHASLEDTVIVLPIDSFTDGNYAECIESMAAVVQNNAYDLVLLGAVPSYPSTKYGYIVPVVASGADKATYNSKAFIEVATFKEKPDEELARHLIEKNALWNCGVFALKLENLARLIQSEIGEDNPISYEYLFEHYEELPKISFDYGVVEHAKSIAAVPYDGTWKDMGTWNTLTEEMVDEVAGRVVVDDQTCNNVHVINETGLPLVIAGLHDAVVIATYDGILVSGKSETPKIKHLVESAAETRPMYEQRKWGEYRVLDSSIYPNGSRSLTKELVIKAHCQLSYQRHMHRGEVWTIASGEGEVVLDGAVRSIEPGSIVEIPQGVLHSLFARTEIHLIEVQLGDYLEEEDIYREGMWWS